MTLQSYTNSQPSTSNGNGAARPRVERGRSVAHRKDSKAQRAAKAAAVYRGDVVYRPTRRELSFSYGVSAGMIDRARALSVEQRQAVAGGPAKLPPLNNGQGQLATERVLAIASAVEQAARH